MAMALLAIVFTCALSLFAPLCSPAAASSPEFPPALLQASPHRWQVIAAVIIVALQTLLIFALLSNQMQRRQAEADMLRMNAELEARVAERTRDLERANRELRFAKDAQEMLNGILRKMNEELDRNARTDMLTGLVNRRDMTEKMHVELDKYRQTGRGFSLVIGDIDHFKQINDGYGHNAGDMLLRAVAERLRQVVRPDDTVARWGGEEFLCLLPETELVGAMAVAERMRAAVADHEFCWSGCPVSISITFGVSSVGPADNIDDILHRADQALYRGKQSGRNRVFVAPLPESLEMAR
ncbi:diguanylate cyclase [Heliobacterium undosum]|uniref:Diguanylate cyclase n=1 Tax=Heliomicrobium undosum TaxID=121734 RepID=A0A845L1R8_9FIRM|nr:GGDEF domain-containing protein [Heliomicrobium undosum]MZP29576.1 diguanylate cyclase [Heliomicrobium undosum]